DYRAISPFWGWQWNQRDSWSLNKFVGAWWNGVANSDGDVLFNGYGASASVTFANNQSGNIGGNLQMATMDDRLLRGGPLAENPAGWSLNASFNTDTRRKAWFNPFANYQKNIDDPSWNGGAGLYVETRPSSQVRVTVGPNYNRGYNTAQFIKTIPDANAASTYQSRYVFANVDQTTL